jgi:hypothetical protein
MIGKFIGKLLSTPVRLINVPVKVFDNLCDPAERPIKERDPLKLDEIADAIDEACGDD